MPIEKIISPVNPGIKRVVRLRMKKGRDAKGLTLVEGVREIRQAVNAGLRVAAVYFCREGVFQCPQDFLNELEAKKLKIFETNCIVFDKISYGDRKEGILALVEPRELKLSDLRLSDKPLVVVLEKVEKPGNLGAVLRTADGARIDALIVTDASTDVHNPNVIRASLGAVFSVPTVMCTNEEALSFLKDKGIRAVSAVVQAEGFYYDKDLTAPTAFIFGSEQDGLSDFWIKYSDEKVRIPMLGKLDSLNVSVSAAVMIYEAVRQRTNKK